ncbi:MAG TPA: hypothetical protein VHI13_11785 [Candidatus Kapabacteria bacterium]|nr:hypothetical protein [Candidatus Kapabacteria bacterium]
MSLADVIPFLSKTEKKTRKVRRVTVPCDEPRRARREPHRHSAPHPTGNHEPPVAPLIDVKPHAVKPHTAQKPGARKHAAKKPEAKKHAAPKHAARKPGAKKHAARKHAARKHATEHAVPSGSVRITDVTRSKTRNGYAYHFKVSIRA